MPRFSSIKLNTLIVLGIILAITFIAFSPGLSGGFYHDDTVNLVYNDKVKIDTLSIDALHEAATSSGSGRLKRPVSMASFALNYYFFGEEPYSFKLTNLFLHLFTGIVVFLFTLILQKIQLNSKSIINNKRAIYISLAVTALWLLHPLHVSSVAYIVQRMAILSTLFIVLSCLFYTLARLNQLNNKRSLFLFFSSAIFFFLAIFSKENGILIPVYFILIELVFFKGKQFSFISRETLKRSALAITFLLVTATLFTLPHLLDYLNAWYANTREFTLEQRALSQARIVIHYIKWFFFPNISELGLYHDDIPISTSLFNPITTILSIGLLLLLASFALIINNKRPFITFGIFWFFIGHLLESTVIPLEMVYEHRNYLPYIGLAIAAIDVALYLIQKISGINRVAIFIGIIICCLFTTLTYARSNQWSSPFSFAYFEALHHPNSNRANHALGMIYRSLVLNGETKFKKDAYQYLIKASEIDSPFIQSEVALLQFSFEQNEPALPQWIDSIAKKLNTNIIRSDYVNLLDQMMQCIQGNCFLPTEARGILIAAAYTNPKLHVRPKIHAKVLSIRANYLLSTGGSVDSAESDLKTAISIDPDDIQNYADYINLLLLKNQPEKAQSILSEAYSADSENAFQQQLKILENNILERLN